MKQALTAKSFAQHEVFDNRFIEIKSFYLSQFEKMPNVSFISQIKGEKACNLFTARYADQIAHTYTYRWYDKKKKKYHFDRTVLVLHSCFILEFNESYVDMLHDGTEPELLDAFTRLAVGCRQRESAAKPEVNLIVKGYDGLELKPMEIKRTRLDVGLYYEDDFREVDELIRKRLNKKNDKGIVLLHGLPGTGKTTYLRYLIGRIKKQVLFLSPDTAGRLSDPAFIELLIDNPDSVLIIEDAEHILMDRRSNSNSSVSTLLNISDGLLADCLNVQLICTFNNALTLVDEALMRQGRLIARYAFGKLSVDKAQKLSAHLGLQRAIAEPLTLAELTHPGTAAAEPKALPAIGFRRSAAVSIN